MNETRYVFRMDDACPWMDHDRWSQLEETFDRYGVKPVVAVVPDCQDPDLKRSAEDPEFWNRVRGWEAKGWDIALHGFDHVYRGNTRGLVPFNDRTEFAGQPEPVQRQKIRDGWKLLLERGLHPTVWIAPAHTFDRQTLTCLEEETTIRIVSDGLATRPFRRFGFQWVPQLIWKPRRCPPGVWTICLHPNTMSSSMPGRIEAFLKEHAAEVTSIANLPPSERDWGVGDEFFAFFFLFTFRLKNGLADILKTMGFKR